MAILDEDAVWQRLGSTHLGRIGISVGALPVVVPAVFAVVDRRLALAIDPETHFAGAVDGSVVAFEASGHDEALERWWSVLIRATCSLADPDGSAAAALEGLGLEGAVCPAIVVPVLLAGAEVASPSHAPLLGSYLAATPGGSVH